MRVEILRLRLRMTGTTVEVNLRIAVLIGFVSELEVEDRPNLKIYYTPLTINERSFII